MKIGIEKVKAIEVMDIGAIRPARGVLLVKPNPRQEVSAGGIIIPEAKKTKDKIGVESGVIVSRGLPFRNKKGVEFRWEYLTEGTTVYYTWTAGTELKTRDGTFLLILHNEIIAWHENHISKAVTYAKSTSSR